MRFYKLSVLSVLFFSMVVAAHGDLSIGGSLLIDIDARDITLNPGDPVNNWNNNGTLSGHFAASVGQIPQVEMVGGVRAVTFRGDGNADYMILKNVDGMQIAVPSTLTGNSDWSIEVWVYKRYFRNVEEAILQWASRGGPDGTAGQIHYTAQSAKPFWAAAGHWGDADMGWSVPSDTTDAKTPALYKWHHFVFTFDGSIEKVYVDGAMVNSESKTLNIWGPSSAHPGIFVLGSAAYQWSGVLGDFSFDGSIAVLRVHQNALTSEGVENNYTIDAAYFNPPSEPEKTFPAEPFSLHKVRLLDSPFKEAMDVDRQYLLSLEPDRFLAGFRIEAGLTPKANHYGGWEVDARGHTTGHYLSACALMYASTGDVNFLNRVNYMVDELALCQQTRGDGYVGAVPDGNRIFSEIKSGSIVVNDQGHLNGGWVPWYLLHKIYAGLRDAYLYCGNTKALTVLTGACDWVLDVTGGLTDSQMQTMLQVEHGGLYEVFADVYALTGDAKYRSLAERWYQGAVMNPLASQFDPLSGLHANTQIPKVIGAARYYEITGNASNKTIATFFWDRVVNHHSYSNGGNSEYENFHEPDVLAGHMGSGDMTETCNTYNMLKLTRHLFAWDVRADVMDYYERGLYNHILASSYHLPGYFTYKQGLFGGYFQPFSRPFDDFWCCVGTGMENHAKYGESIYYHDPNGVFVNLFIPSTLNWEEKGVSLRMDTAFPDDDQITLTFTCAQPVSMPVRIRYPGWAQNGMIIQVNGQPFSHSNQPGSYVPVERLWSSGDILTVRIPMSLRVEPTPDNPNRVAIFYGPVLLAGVFGFSGLPAPGPYGSSASSSWQIAIPKLIRDARPLEQRIVPVQGQSLTFQTVNAAWPVDATLIPLFRSHDQHFTAYWDVLDEAPPPPPVPAPDPVWTGGPYTFNGTSDVVVLENGIVSGLYDITVCAWVNVDETRIWQRIFDFGSGEAITMCMIPQTWDNKYAFIIKNGEGTDQWISASGTFSLDVWHHVAVTLQGGTGILYLDGHEVGRNESIAHLPISLGETTQNYLGDSQFVADPLYKGQIDDFRIYNRALDANEIDCITNGNLWDQGDLNCNRQVNLTDFVILASQWLNQPGRPSADIAPKGAVDGVVNLMDLQEFCKSWLQMY